MAQQGDKGSWNAYRIQMRTFVEKMTREELQALFWQVYDEDERVFDEDKLQTTFLASLTPEQATVYRDLALAQQATMNAAFRPRSIYTIEESQAMQHVELKNDEFRRLNSRELQEMIHFVAELMDNVDEYQHKQSGGGVRTLEARKALFRRVSLFIGNVEAAYLTANPVEERDAKMLFSFTYLKNSLEDTSEEDDEVDDEDDFEQSDEQALKASTEFDAELERMATMNFPQVVEDIKKCVLNGFSNRLSLQTIMDQAIALYNAMDLSR